jgi:NADPH:quinone reductase-like Zn-dependent oxidoreductase
MLKLPLPDSPTTDPFPVLIHGGSTATGMWGIQFAKASGLTVIATASPSNFDRLRSLGADAVFDYHSPDCGAEIRKLTENKLRYAWDCVGDGEVLCGKALSDSEPSKYAVIIESDGKMLAQTNPQVEGPFFTLGYDIFGEPYEWRGRAVPRKPDEVEHAIMFYEVARKLLASGIVKPIDPILNNPESGLEGVLKGLDKLRAGEVRAGKLVYTL